MGTPRPLLVLTLLVLLPVPARAAKAPFRFPEARHGAQSELKYVNGVPVLVVAGTPAAMGTAAGVLAVRPAARVLDYPRDLLSRHKVGWLWETFVRSGKEMVRHFPPEYREELEALVKAGGVPRDAVIAGNTLFDLKKFVACSAVLIDGDRSATGGPLLARNLDYPSLGYIQEYSLVTVYRPKGKHAFASIGFPGLLGCLSGINDAGLSLAVLEVFDVKQGEKRFNSRGIPYALCNRKLLEECTTIAEARKLLERLPRTTTINLAVADRGGVAVFEVSPGRVVERAGERGACICTNHFCTPALKPKKPLNVSRSFQRFATLGEVRSLREKVSTDDLRKTLHAANLGDQTLQTMVLEPATLRLHLGIGRVPSSAAPLRKLDLAPLFKRGRPGQP